MGQPRYDAIKNQYVYGLDQGPDDDVANAVDGAITHAGGTHALTKPSVGAYTLSVPTADEEGTRLLITNRTAFAHVVTVAGGLGGNAADDVLTFNAKIGSAIELQAGPGYWFPVNAPYLVVIS
jgi:hypothetical protein